MEETRGNISKLYRLQLTSIQLRSGPQNQIHINNMETRGSQGKKIPKQFHPGCLTIIEAVG